MDVDNKRVAPVGFKGGSWEGVVEDVHVFHNTIGRQGDIVDGEPVLPLASIHHIEGTSAILPVFGVFS